MDTNTQSDTAPRRVSRRFAVGTILTVLAGFSLGMVTGGSQEIPPAEASGLVVPLQTRDAVAKGESLVLVIGGVYDSQAEAAAAAASMPLGETQGFYVDQTNNYRLRGSYQQTSTDKTWLKCGPDGAGPKKCFAHDAGTYAAHAPVVLRHHDLTDIDSLLNAAEPLGCGKVGKPRCKSKVFPKLVRGTGLAPGKWLTVSGFRTKKGAEQFMELMRSIGGAEDLVSVRAEKAGGPDIGLGQEEHPDGSGPLLDELPNQEYFQE